MLSCAHSAVILDMAACHVQRPGSALKDQLFLLAAHTKHLPLALTVHANCVDLSRVTSALLQLLVLLTAICQA